MKKKFKFNFVNGHNSTIFRLNLISENVISFASNEMTVTKRFLFLFIFFFEHKNVGGLSTRQVDSQVNSMITSNSIYRLLRMPI